MIVPKNKGTPFTDDDSSSRFANPDEFVFHDTTAMQNMFVHLSRNSSKLNLRSNSSSSNPNLNLNNNRPPKGRRLSLMKEVFGGDLFSSAGHGMPLILLFI